MYITEEYKKLQQQLHAKGDYGISGSKHTDRILGLCQKLKTRDVLDFGCGKQTLSKSLPFPIQNYDPCIPGLDRQPVPADLVVCSDVLEHVEPECLHEVLRHLGALTKKCIFMDINNKPAQKILADGRNAHLIQENSLWWHERLDPFFDIHSFQTYASGLVLVATPRVVNG